MTPSNPTPAPTTPVPPALDAARRALAAVLDPALGSAPDGEGARLAVAEALAVLSDTDPPYPPDRPTATTEPDDPTARGDPRRGIARALTHLEAAAGQATSIPELTRIATAALILRHRRAVT